MGYDTSFHPIDLALLQQRIYPYLLGETGPHAIDDLVADAVRIARVRFRANTWAIGAIGCEDAAAIYDSSLYVWGRPFLVTGQGTETIAAQIDAYLTAQPEDVDALARGMLDALMPGFADRVTPSDDGFLPDDPILAQGLRQRLDLMRDCIAAIRAGHDEVTYHDRTFEPRQLVGRELMDVVVDFGAQFRPGWMSRGYTWPTAQLEGTVAEELFIANIACVMPIYQALPGLPWEAADTIYENYMVGGCLSPGDIPAVRQELAALPPDEELTVDRQKLDEALADAQHRHMPFAEATEIYSGVSGVMN